MHSLYEYELNFQGKHRTLSFPFIVQKVTKKKRKNLFTKRKLDFISRKVHQNKVGSISAEKKPQVERKKSIREVNEMLM